MGLLRLVVEGVSEKNRVGKSSARERLREQREKDRIRARRRRGMGVAGAVVAVLGVAAGVGMVATRTGGDAKSGGPAVAPRGASGTVIPTGKASAEKTLTVYEDFRCPGCKQFEDVFRTTVHQLQDKGRLKVRYHLVTIIDGNLGGAGSLTAANAAACAQDAGKYVAYHDVLYKNQPSETKDAYADKSKLIKLAGKVPGLDTKTFRGCVEEGRHDAWVRKSNDGFARSGYSSTPTVLLEGKSIYGDPNKPLSPRKLKRMVVKG